MLKRDEGAYNQTPALDRRLNMQGIASSNKISEKKTKKKTPNMKIVKMGSGYVNSSTSNPLQQ